MHPALIGLIAIVGVVVALSVIATYFGRLEDRHFIRTTQYTRVYRHLGQLVEQSHRWSEAHDGNCPTFADLVATGQLSPDNTGVDPWGTPYRLMCPADDFSAMSAGEDRAWSTTDDARITFTEYQARQRESAEYRAR